MRGVQLLPMMRRIQMLMLREKTRANATEAIRATRTQARFAIACTDFKRRKRIRPIVLHLQLKGVALLNINELGCGWALSTTIAYCLTTIRLLIGAKAYQASD